MSVLVVTGTDTGVGKTVTTAAVAALARARGASVAVVKPAQTGARPGMAGDLDEIRRLAGITDVHEYARYAAALAPAAAARLAGLPPPDLVACAERIRALDRDLVIVEGAGGLLVRYDDDGATLADLAHSLKAAVLVTVRPGLGTLNHTALTLEAMAGRGIDLAGIVIGAWPRRPLLDDLCNVRDLETIAARPLSGVLPERSGRLDGAEFLLAARAGLAPHLGGVFDPAAFREDCRTRAQTYGELIPREDQP
ncbi:dethiobiotin synthase [Actinoallomurus iriomotensis]|uniref:ATP-dependent dethiobiotin synthetase BioD n=1 Tax=Actinoallomurus iriomotensis TaxID=478107 RepID=A0A9W6RC24_9ACTN|nr:dethiobiotin synthase [Actinoallomurus iriomotensis]GLY73076.1 ATP-dependent dethiobiotin synthetase BioD [Actinoallomurus iriomotensis]